MWTAVFLIYCQITTQSNMKTLCITLVLALIALAAASKSEANGDKYVITNPFGGSADGCDCYTYDACSCCAWDVPVIDDVCVNVTWHDYTIDTYLIINDEVVAHREITGKDTKGPVDICASVKCDVCIQMQNLNISTTGACGSIYLNVTCDHFATERDLDDFKMGDDCTIPKEEIKTPMIFRNKEVTKNILRDALEQAVAAKVFSKYEKPTLKLALNPNRPLN